MKTFTKIFACMTVFVMLSSCGLKNGQMKDSVNENDSAKIIVDSIHSDSISVDSVNQDTIFAVEDSL